MYRNNSSKFFLFGSNIITYKTVHMYHIRMLTSYAMLILFSTALFYVNTNDFHYLETDVIGNYTVVVIVDSNFMFHDYRDIQEEIRDLIEKAKGEYLWQGQLVIKYSNINDFNPKDDIMAVFCVLSCEDLWNMFIDVSDDSLIYMAITDANCPRLPTNQAITMPLTSPGLEVSQLLLDLRTAHVIDWRSVGFIHDTSVASDLVHGIIKSLTTNIPQQEKAIGSLVMVFQVNNTDDKWKRSKEIVGLMKTLPKLNKNSNFLVLTNLELVATVLEAVKSLNMVNPQSKWLFFIPDTNVTVNLTQLSSHLEEGENVAFVYNSSVYNSKCLSGLHCHLRESLNFLIMALNRSLQEELELSKKVSDEEWGAIKPTKYERRDSLIKFLKNRMSETGICDNCTSWRFQTGELWGRDYIDKPLEEVLLDIGFWNPRHGAQLSDELFPHSAHGFRGINLPIASIHFPPWQIIKYNDSGHAVEYSGLVFDIINLLAKKLNFTYSVVIPSNTSLGFSNIRQDLKDGVEMMSVQGENDVSVVTVFWEKMITLIKNKKVFIGACATTLTQDRSAAVNFTIPISTDPYMFLVSRPKELSRALLFMLPFTSDTWLCIIGAFALMTPLLNIVHRLSPYYDHYGKRGTGGFNTMTNCFWYLYGALLQQGGGHLPTADSGRLLIGTWWLVVLVIVTTYCGNLVAFLTFPKMDKVVTNIHELLDHQDSLTWGIPIHSTLHSLLMTTDDPSLKAVAERAHLHDTLTPEVVQRVREGKHVFIQRRTILLFLMKREFLLTNSCDFSLGYDEFFREELGMAVFKDSPYLEIINKEIGQMHRVGLINKWLHNYLPMKDRCWSTVHANEVNNHTVNLDDMQGSFFVLFLGFVIAITIIIVEFLIKKYRLAREQAVIRPYVP